MSNTIFVNEPTIIGNLYRIISQLLCVIKGWTVIFVTDQNKIRLFSYNFIPRKIVYFISTGNKLYIYIYMAWAYLEKQK
jgi:hypothetical protein